MKQKRQTLFCSTYFGERVSRKYDQKREENDEKGGDPTPK
jgi:hypothetical protein